MRNDAETILANYRESIMPVIQELISVDYCMVAMADTKKFIYYRKANKIDIGDIVGMALPSEDTMAQALKLGTTVTVCVPAKVFGKRFRSTCCPIRDKDGNIIGGFGIGSSVDDVDVLNNVTHKIVSSVEELAGTSEEIDVSTSVLSKAVSSLKSSCTNVIFHAKKTGDILELINEIAIGTDLVALNPTIENAGTGQEDRGFAVVMNEIRKISTKSATSVMHSLLKSMRNELDKMLKQIDELSEQTILQTIATEQMAPALIGLSTAAGELSKISEETNAGEGANLKYTVYVKPRCNKCGSNMA